ncbi:hypothetical protein LZ575_13080 [Antarcticibacterium sp. 1MA-6-2]|uniref:hypothetical protein n=1 Tax=Antarcticibacterium sp. 1MA-6-2 TaxID=2908210 RepID=UPI001F1AF5A5|nr:hypothetical protein [Antarcticibacterium sp. 1MA-6-2]UJH89915.1 hypothetical protein LZ575_13080 [Antarcticibacterium sp. 1MA-6-2]
MDLKARKISFVQEFFRLESEESISRFEELLLKEKLKINQELKPMSIEELRERIGKSLEDSHAGQVTEVNDLLLEIEKWR